jgi:hypothetical protein
MSKAAQPPTRKSQIDAVLLALPGVAAKKIGGLDTYLVGDRMFACINGEGIGIRLPIAKARDLQLFRQDVAPFQPRGLPSSQEWIQIDRADAADYGKDLDLFKASIEYVRSQGR